MHPPPRAPPPRAVRRTREEVMSMLDPSPAEILRASRPPLPIPARQIYANIRHEYHSIRRRMDSVAAAIDKINEYLSDLARELRRYPNKKIDIEPLQHLYILEIKQKREELMRLRDRIVELRNMLRTMHIQYEIPYVEGSSFFPYGFGGGASNKTGTRRHKWSLKYKRSIDCNHPKGFSQKQHCKYSRNKFTK